MVLESEKWKMMFAVVLSEPKKTENVIKLKKNIPLNQFFLYFMTSSSP
jgi:hypothetical protein